MCAHGMVDAVLWGTVRTAPLVWVAPKAAVTGSVADYVKSVQAAGDKVNYGSIGAGSGSHLAMELIKERLGLKAVHIPFAGGPQILNGILSGEIQMTLRPARPSRRWCSRAR